MTEPGGAEIPQSIHEAAEKWLARRAGQSDPALERDFALWIDADPRHGIAYDLVKRDWQLGTLLRERKVGRTRSLGRAPFWMRQKTHVAAAGLGAAILLGVASVGLLRPGGPFAISAAAQAAVYETAVGEIRTIGLADGSTVILDTASRLRVHLSGGERRLNLDRGRARFQVAEDQRRVFRVRVAGGEVVAHGTMFDVSLIGGHPLVTVLEGSVELHRPDTSGAPRTLVPGRSMALDGHMTEQAVSRAEARWVSGMLALDATPLAEAVAAINRYNRTQISLAESFPMPLRVTGAFGVRDPEGFARAVAASFHLKVERPDSRTILLVAPPTQA
ncbi:FecR domain-containing protein [Sphingobium sp.]|uniref:FecR family protein n=1 Tax=Sphingobium sp. TaxID=1912891 RepID=UPI0035C74240